MKMFVRLASLMAMFALVLLMPVTVDAAELNISWSQPVLELEGFPGTVQTASVEFTANKGLAAVDVWVVPELARFIDVAPKAGIPALSNAPVELQMVVSIPASTEPGVYEGTVHVRHGRRTVPSVLKVSLFVTPATSSTVPEGATLPTDDRIVADTRTGGEFVRDEIIVGLNENYSVDDLKSLVDGLGGQFLGSILPLGFYQVVFPRVVDVSELDAVIQVLNASLVTDFAGRSWIAQPLEDPPDLDAGFDPEYRIVDPDDIWDEENPSGPTAPLEFARFPSAWKENTGSRDVPIAVIDGGFNVLHEDLLANIRLEESNAGSGLEFPHGTMVAGTLAAVGNNKKGVTGAMWNARVTVYSTAIPGSDEKWPFYAMVAEATKAVVAGAKIVNLSGGIPTLIDLAALDEELLFRAFLQWPATDDVLFVIAAGKTTRETVYVPARLSSEFDNVLSVTHIDVVPGYTFDPVSVLRGPGGDVDVAAPGCVLTTIYLTQYTDVCGSSFATPMVSGLAGLLLSEKAALTAQQLKRLIIRGAVEGGTNVLNPNSGELEDFFVIDAGKTFELISEPPNPPLAFPQKILATFTGTIFELSLPESVADILGISVGTPISGSYTIDPNAPNMPGADPYFTPEEMLQMFGGYANAVSELDLKVGPYTVSNSKSGSLVINNDVDFNFPAFRDLFQVSWESSHTDFESDFPVCIGNERLIANGFGLSLYDFAGTALTSTDIPLIAPDPSEFDGLDPSVGFNYNDRALTLYVDCVGAGGVIYATFDTHTFTVITDPSDPDFDYVAVGEVVFASQSPNLQPHPNFPYGVQTGDPVVFKFSVDADLPDTLPSPNVGRYGNFVNNEPGVVTAATITAPRGSFDFTSENLSSDNNYVYVQPPSIFEMWITPEPTQVSQNLILTLDTSEANLASDAFDIGFHPGMKLTFYHRAENGELIAIEARISSLEAQ